MANEFYTLIVVPHAKAQFRKFQIPVGLVRRARLLGGVCGAVLFGLFAHYVYMNVQAREMRQLRAENQSLATRTGEYQKLTEGLKAQLSQLQTTVTKLGVMAGVEVEQNAPAGVGGATSYDSLAPDLKSYIQGIDQEVSDLKRRSARLETFLTDQKIMLASTPSTWPVRGYLSTSFGNRLDPFTGQPDFHPGIDIATPDGHAHHGAGRRHGDLHRAQGRVRQRHRHQPRLRHGHPVRPPQQHRGAGRPEGESRRHHRLRGQHRTLHRSAPALRGLGARPGQEPDELHHRAQPLAGLAQSRPPHQRRR